MARQRLDQLLVVRGLAESREKAQRIILAGAVTVAGQLASKPGHTYPSDAAVSVESSARFVSRGGDKLEAAFTAFNLDVKGAVCIDIGASTGGFTDCLLQHGAAMVYAVDVGTGQLHWRLRNDKRVVVMEKVNARFLQPSDIPGKISVAVVDASFISLTLLLGAVTDLIERGGRIVSLIKPQFEAGRELVEKGGVVRDQAVRDAVIEKVRLFGIEKLGLTWEGVVESPLRGPAGNAEYLACWRKTK